MRQIRTDFQKKYPREETMTNPGINVLYVTLLESIISEKESEINEFENSFLGKIYCFLKRKSYDQIRLSNN